MSDNKKYSKSRPVKTLRNAALSLLLCLGAYALVWAANGFAAVSVGSAMRRCEDSSMTERSKIVEVSRDDGDCVSIVGLTSDSIHLTVAERKGIGFIKNMYEPLSFMDVPRSRDGVDVVALPPAAGGSCVYNEVYDADIRDINGKTVEKPICSEEGICLIICQNSEISRFSVDIWLRNGNTVESRCYERIEKNDSGVYPLRYFCSADGRISKSGGNLISNGNSDGYLRYGFDAAPTVTVRGYSADGRLLVSKIIND